MILRKSFKLLSPDVTQMLKSTKFDFGLGFALDPMGELLKQNLRCTSKGRGGDKMGKDARKIVYGKKGERRRKGKVRLPH